jgi:prepilin-type N-terminal cleavage/methylation domain-containing protein
MPNKQYGFTLVELAIVLMIIGLLIGGVLRGQELMANAQVSSAIEQVKAYEGAWHTFTDEYSALPGDMPNATTKLPGCTAANSCQDGNGDSVIGTLGAGAVGQPWIDVDNTIPSENSQFWRQLALAHLITGVDPSADTPDWGKTNPTASIGGGFFIHYADFNGGGTFGTTSAHYLVLRNTITGQWVCGGGTSTGACVISPMRAAQIDRKADDGVATTGDIIAISANWQNGCGTSGAGLNGPNGYAETQSDKACDMMFQIQ